MSDTVWAKWVASLVDHVGAWSIPSRTFVPSIRPMFRFQKGHHASCSYQSVLVQPLRNPSFPIVPSLRAEELAKASAALFQIVSRDANVTNCRDSTGLVLRRSSLRTHGVRHTDKESESARQPEPEKTCIALDKGALTQPNHAIVRVIPLRVRQANPLSKASHFTVDVGANDKMPMIWH